MTSNDASSGDEFELDPVFINSLREALAILAVWFVALIWTVPVCWYLGFHREVTSETVPIVFGMPAWVFWGVAIPWLGADVITTVLCFMYIKNDPLGLSEEDIEHAQQKAANKAATEQAAGRKTGGPA